MLTALIRIPLFKIHWEQPIHAKLYLLWLELYQIKQTICTCTQANNLHEGQHGGTAAHANLTHPAAPNRNEIVVKLLCNLLMLTLMTLKEPREAAAHANYMQQALDKITYKTFRKRG